MAIARKDTIAYITHTGNNDYSMYERKSIKGFFRYETSDKRTVPQAEVDKRVYLNFIVYYYWYSATACDLIIGWEPGYYDSANSKYARYDTSTLSTLFSTDSKIQLKLNGSTLTPFNGKNNLKDSRMLTTSSDGIITPLAITSSYFAPAWIGRITGVTSDIKNLEITFEYSNTISYTNYTLTGLINLTERNKIKINKPSRYEHNVVFNEEGLNELIDNIKKYPIIKIDEVTNTSTWNDYTKGKPCLKITYGDNTKVFSGYEKANGSAQTATTTGYQYVPVGSNIKFKDTDGNDLDKITTNASQKSGTFRVSVNSDTFEVPIKGLAGGSGSISLGGSLIPTIDSQTASSSGYNLGSSNNQWNILYARAAVFGNADEASDGKSDAASNVRPYTNNTGSLGTDSIRWKNIYGVNGDITNLTVNGNVINTTKLNSAINGSSDTTKFWRGDANWSNELTGTLILSNTTDAEAGSNKNVALVVGNRTNQHLEIDGNEILSKTNANTIGTLYLNQNCNINSDGYLTATRVYNAVFNDYAEYRTTINLTPGHVVIDNDNGSLSCSSTRLQPGAQVISDTFGHSMGETDTAKTPLAVAGRVLAYTYQPRENYHAGMAVCSAPNGTVDIMTREEIRDYPDCIIGIVSEIPQYETWGSDNIKVDGRIWIKVK